MHVNCASLELRPQASLTTACFESFCWSCLSVFSRIKDIMASLLFSSSSCDRTLHTFAIFLARGRNVSQLLSDARTEGVVNAEPSRLETCHCGVI
jgi:hypothetical protein